MLARREAIFPAGAVTQTLTVSATYLAKEAEFPLPMPEGTVFVAGAQMTPEHTSFLRPVTLRFANDLGFAPGTPVPFAFASHDEEDPNEGFYDSGMAVVTPDGAFIELQVTHFSCVALGVAPPPGTNQGEPCPTCPEVKEIENPALKCNVPGTSSVCATDGNVRVEQRLASVGALGGRDTLEFAYTSATAHPRPLISAQKKLSSLYFPSAPASSSWKVSLEGVEREVFYQPTTDTTHLTLGWDPVDAGGARLSTGAYHFRATSSDTYSGSLYTAAIFGGLPTEPTNVQSSRPLSYKAVTGGYVILNDQSASPFGAGWGLTELERLHPQPDGTVLWTSGRGASAVMKAAQKQLLTSLPPRAGGIVRDANGNLYVARLSGEIMKVTPEGTTSTFATLGAGLDPTDLAFDRSGTRLYGHTRSGRVFRIDSTGAVTTLAQVGNDLGGLALDSKGNVFVLDSHHPRIYKVTPSGQVSIFGGYVYPSPNPLLTYPSGIVIDKHDNLYVSNNYNVPGQVRCGVSYISKITPAGGHSYYALGLNAPRGLALDEVGNLYAADVSCGAGNVAIRMISPTGLITTLDRAYPRPETGAEPPYGYSYDLVAHPNGKLYLVTDQGSVYDTSPLAPPAGVPVRYAGAAGEHSTLDRHADGRYTRTSKYSTRFEFDSGGQLIARVEPNGSTTSYTYDTQGRLVERTNAAGQAWTFAYSGDGLSVVTDPAGRTTSFAVSGGDLMSVTHPDGSTVSFSYDRHLLTGKTDARGQTTTYAYDANGKASTVSLPTGESRHFDVGRSRTAIHSLPPGVGTEGNPAPPVRETDREDRYTNGRGFVTRYVSNALGAMTEATRPDGQVYRTDRDPDNNPMEIFEPGGRRVSQVFDGEGNLLTSEEEGGSYLSVLYSAAFHSKPQTVRDALGFQYTFIYDAGGNLVSTSDPFFRQTRYVIGAYGLPLRAELPDGGVLEYAYDAQGRLTEVKDQLQRTSRFDYDAAGNMARVTDPANRVTEYQYDAVNRLLEVKDALGQRTTFAYEAACTGCGTNRHQLTRITDAKGRPTRFEYDPIGQLTKVTDPLGRSRTFTYDLNRNLASFTDAKGQTISFEYDSLDRLVTKERPEGAESYGYDVAGNVIALGDPDSSLALSYDVLNRLVQVTPGGALPPLGLSYTYDRRNDRTSLGRPWGTLQYDYDPLRNMSQIRGLPGATSSVEFGYDALNRRRQVAGLLSEGFAYDLAGQLTSHTSSAGSVLGWEYSYDLVGNRTREVLSEAYVDAPPRISASPDPAVAPTSRAVLLGQVAGIEGSINSTVSVNGQPVSVALDGTFQTEVTIAPGPNAVLIEATRPSGASAQRSISISGEPTPLPTRLLSADGSGILYGTDAQGRTVSVASDGGLSIISELSPSPSHVARAVDGTLYAWYGTQLRKLENSTLVDVATVPFLPEDIALLPGGTWLLTQAFTVYRFDPSSGGPTAWATLPAAGNRLLVAGNAAGEALAATDTGQVFRIDSAGQVSEWTSSVSFATIDDIALDDAGSAFIMKVSPDSPDYISTCQECPDCSECINIVRLSPAGDATVLFAFPTQPYGVADSSGNFYFINTSGLNRIPAEGNQGEPFVATGQDLIVQIQIDPPEPSIRARDFTYDTLDRLATATPGETYAYDPVGNRTSSHRSTLHVVDAANQLLEDAAYLYAYDLNGNLVQKESKQGAGITRYFWDSQNRLVRVEIPGTVAEYVYDPLGRRIQKTVNGVVTKYLYDGQDIVAELDGNGDVVTTFIHGPGIDEPLTITRGGQSYLYHRDGLGSITHLTDQAGNVVQRYQYDAYGDITAQLDPGFVQPYAFTGREWDTETGLYYYRARYYDPKIGRFLSDDPIGFAGGEVNLYAYVGGNPVNAVDPLGLAGIPNPNGIVPGGPWAPNNAPGARPGNFLGPKGPEGGRPQVQWVPPQGEGGPPGSEGYWKVNKPGQKGWERYDQEGKPKTPEEVHPNPKPSPDRNQRVPTTLPPWVVPVVTVGTGAAIVVCFASGVCEVATVATAGAALVCVAASGGSSTTNP